MHMNEELEGMVIKNESVKDDLVEFVALWKCFIEMPEDRRKPFMQLLNNTVNDADEAVDEFNNINKLDDPKFYKQAHELLRQMGHLLEEFWKLQVD